MTRDRLLIAIGALLLAALILGVVLQEVTR